MMAAISASLAGKKVILLEKNEKLGKKLFITGKGRCNITNACEPEDFLSHVSTNSRFLYSSFSRKGMKLSQSTVNSMRRKAIVSLSLRTAKRKRRALSFPKVWNRWDFSFSQM